MTAIISLIAQMLLTALFLYAKLLPYKDKLDYRYQKVFNVIHQIFGPILSTLRKWIKPVQIGPGLMMDMTQLILFVVLLLVLSYV